MSMYASLVEKPSSLPLGLQYLKETFPEISFSQTFCNKINAIESLRQEIFSAANTLKSKQHFSRSLEESVQDFRLSLSFIPPKRSVFRAIFSSCPSEETLALMYAAAGVMGAWMCLTSKEGPEAWSRSIFKEMLDVQVSGKSSVSWKKSLKAQTQTDDFWQANPDLFAVVDRLLT